MRKQALISGSILGLVLALPILSYAATADFQGSCMTTGSPTAPSVDCLFDAQRGSGSSCPGSAILSYSWSYGDGTGGLAGSLTSHTYTSPLAGSYRVDLLVTCWDGSQATRTRWVCIAFGFPGCIKNNAGWN
jgi:hypothetical protein